MASVSEFVLQRIQFFLFVFFFFFFFFGGGGEWGDVERGRLSKYIFKFLIFFLQRIQIYIFFFGGGGGGGGGRGSGVR